MPGNREFFLRHGRAGTGKLDRAGPGYSYPSREHHGAMDQLDVGGLRHVEVGADWDGKPILEPGLERGSEM